MLVDLLQHTGGLIPHLANLVGRGGRDGQDLVSFRDDPVHTKQSLDRGQRAKHPVGRHRLEDLLRRRIRSGNGLGDRRVLETRIPAAGDHPGQIDHHEDDGDPPQRGDGGTTEAVDQIQTGERHHPRQVVGGDAHRHAEEQEEDHTRPDGGHLRRHRETIGEELAQRAAQAKRDPEADEEGHQVEGLPDEPTKPTPHQQPGDEQPEDEVDHCVLRCTF